MRKLPEWRDPTEHFCQPEMSKIPVFLADHQPAIAALLKMHPYLSVEPGSAAIEDENSELHAIRKKSLVTGSMAGVLWNCKRGTSRGQYLFQKAGIVPEPEISDFAKTCMAAGREWEPKINQYFSMAMAAEYRRLTQGQDVLGIWLPGPFVGDVDNPTTRGGSIQRIGVNSLLSATADGLFTFKWEDWWCWFHYELKFFASKSTLPEELPEDYLAQTLMQMELGHTERTVLVGAVLCDGVLMIRCWLIGAQIPHHQDFWRRVRVLREELADVKLDQKSSRCKKEGNILKDLVVKYTDNCIEIWEWIFGNLNTLDDLH